MIFEIMIAGKCWEKAFIHIFDCFGSTHCLMLRFQCHYVQIEGIHCKQPIETCRRASTKIRSGLSTVSTADAKHKSGGCRQIPITNGALNGSSPFEASRRYNAEDNEYVGRVDRCHWYWIIIH